MSICVECAGDQITCSCDPSLAAGRYFNSTIEADEFLDMDASEEECEAMFYQQNDRYTEWIHWRKLWEDGNG